MCLIMWTDKRKMPLNWFKNALDHNSDGMGVMFVHDNRLKLFKCVDKDRKEELFKEVNNIVIDKAIHLRMATSGEKDLNNCHPFQILNKDEGDSFDLAVMHNGILSIDAIKDRSDTFTFVEQYLKPMLKQHNTLIYNKAFQDLISKHIGSYNKLLFKDSKGKTIIINETSGEWKKGIWLSNPAYIADKVVYTPVAYNRDYYKKWWDKDYPKKGYGKDGYYGDVYDDDYYDKKPEEAVEEPVIKDNEKLFHKCENCGYNFASHEVTYIPALDSWLCDACLPIWEEALKEEEKKEQEKAVNDN